VREADPRVHGKLNTPGGHVEEGESIADCAVRELREETGLDVVPEGILGVYLQSEGVNFVFVGRAGSIVTSPGNGILSCEWLMPEQIRTLHDRDILCPRKLRAIVADFLAGLTWPMEIIRHVEREEWEEERESGT